jgi:hypothetical protein
MNTKQTTKQAYILPIRETETTFSIHNSNEVLKFTTVNQSEERCLSLLHVEYGEVNFERKSDWVRFVNKLNEYDTTPIKRMAVGNKKISDWGDCKVTVTDIEYSEDGFLIEFNEPQKLVIETIGENYICIEVKKLQGKITWEWYHRKSHNLDIAGICEVYLYDIEIID